MGCCPTCGGDLPIAPRPLIDEEAGTVIFNGQFIRFTEQEMVFFLAVLEASPRMLSRGYLMDLLYPYQIDEPATKVLEQYVLKVRRKIVGTGMKINTVWGRGFQLIYLG